MIYLAYLLIPYLLVLLIQLLIGQPNLLGPMIILTGQVLLSYSFFLSPKSEILQRTKKLILVLFFVIATIVIRYLMVFLQVGEVVSLLLEMIIVIGALLFFGSAYWLLNTNTTNQYQSQFKEGATITVAIIVLAAMTIDPIRFVNPPPQPVPIAGILGYLLVAAPLIYFARSIQNYSKQLDQGLRLDEMLYRKAKDQKT